MRNFAISFSPVSQISTDIYEALVALPNPAAQTPRTNTTLAVSAAHFQSTCKSDISTPKSAKKPQRVSWQITFEIVAQKEFRSSQAPASHDTNDYGDSHCGWPRSQTYFGDRTAALGMREYQTESAPLIQCEGVIKTERALPDESPSGISVE